MANGAPVCPISRDQPVSGMPGIALPIVPRALDLPSLIQAVNAVASALRTMPTNNVAPFIPHGQAQLAAQNTGGSLTITSDWKEVDRSTDFLTIYHLDTQTQKVDQDQELYVERIYQVKFSPAGADANGIMAWKWPQEQQDMQNSEES